MILDKDMQFRMENLKMKKKDKNLWSSGEGIIRTPDFLIFPPMIWIYMEAKGAGIKSKQSSKVFSTLVNKSD